VKKHIEFFDEVTLFADYWIKNSNLEVSFHFSSNHSKVTFFLPPGDNDQIVVFKQHVLRYFEKYRLTNKIELSQRQVVVFMIEDGNDQKTSTWKQSVAKTQFSSCTLWRWVHSWPFQDWQSCYWPGILHKNICQKALRQSEQWEKSKRDESSRFDSKIWQSLIGQVGVGLPLLITLWERTQAGSICLLLWLHLQSRNDYLGGKNRLRSYLFHPDSKSHHLNNGKVSNSLEMIWLTVQLYHISIFFWNRDICPW